MNKKFAKSEEMLNEDHPFAEWIAANKQILGYVAVGLVSLLILGTWWSSGTATKNAADFSQAAFDRTKIDQPTAQAHLETILQRQPTLQARYEAPLAQALLIEGQVSAALPFAERTLQRVASEPTEAYQQFARTSLLIAQKEYAQALEQALALQSAEWNYGMALAGLNQLRIGMLHRELEHPKEAAAAFAAFDKLESLRPPLGSDPEQIQAVKHHADQNELTLQDFLK